MKPAIKIVDPLTERYKVTVTRVTDDTTPAVWQATVSSWIRVAGWIRGRGGGGGRLRSRRVPRHPRALCSPTHSAQQGARPDPKIVIPSEETPIRLTGLPRAFRTEN
jgi:hypothetical protein